MTKFTIPSTTRGNISHYVGNDKTPIKRIVIYIHITSNDSLNYNYLPFSSLTINEIGGCRKQLSINHKHICFIKKNEEQTSCEFYIPLDNTLVGYLGTVKKYLIGLNFNDAFCGQDYKHKSRIYYSSTYNIDINCEDISGYHRPKYLYGYLTSMCDIDEGDIKDENICLIDYEFYDTKILDMECLNNNCLEKYEKIDGDNYNDKYRLYFNANCKKPNIRITYTHKYNYTKKLLFMFKSNINRSIGYIKFLWKHRSNIIPVLCAIVIFASIIQLYILDLSIKYNIIEFSASIKESLYFQTHYK